MMCFGIGFGVKVEPGVNDNSKYFLIIAAGGLGANILALCAFCGCTAMGLAVITGGASLADEESEYEEE
jgi:hypothetical protein